MASEWNPFDSPSPGSQSSRTPNKSGRVYFSKHFPRDFLRPYGLPTDVSDLNNAKFKERLTTFSCEYLTRPGYAMSELAETVIRCRKITPKSELIDDPILLKHFEDKLEAINELLVPFWNDARNSHRNSEMTKEEMYDRVKKVRDLLKPGDDGSLFQDFLHSYIRCSNAMFSMAMNLRVASWALNFPSEVAEKTLPSRDNADFRKDPNLEAYVDVMYQDFCRKTRWIVSEESGARRNLARQMMRVTGRAAPEEDQPCTSSSLSRNPSAGASESNVESDSVPPPSATTSIQPKDPAQTATSSEAARVLSQPSASSSLADSASFLAEMSNVGRDSMPPPPATTSIEAEDPAQTASSSEAAHVLSQPSASSALADSASFVAELPDIDCDEHEFALALAEVAALVASPAKAKKKLKKKKARASEDRPSTSGFGASSSALADSASVLAEMSNVDRDSVPPPSATTSIEAEDPSQTANSSEAARVLSQPSASSGLADSTSVLAEMPDIDCDEHEFAVALTQVAALVASPAKAKKKTKKKKARASEDGPSASSSANKKSKRKDSASPAASKASKKKRKQ